MTSDYHNGDLTTTTATKDDDDPHGAFLERFMTTMSKSQQRQHIMHQYQRLNDRLARRLQQADNHPQHPFSQMAAQRHDQCNRYCDIIPYDHNRVLLSDPQLGPMDHDYINASWISYLPHKRYIATQGPLPSTCGDFWRMVLEQHVKVVVCLTPEIEQGKIKCAAYWPTSASHTACFELHSQSRRRRSFGHHFLHKNNNNSNNNNSNNHTDHTTWTIQVKHIEPMTVNQEAACRIRTLQVTCDRNDDGKTQHVTTATVHQLEFLGWADHGVPQHTQSLTALIQLANRLQQQHHSPMVVHCSAGCGRTGTFCVVDTGLAWLHSQKQHQPLPILEEDDDDSDPVYRITDAFRQQRTTMVQTPAQYLFCYQAIWNQLQQSLDGSSL